MTFTCFILFLLRYKVKYSVIYMLLLPINNVECIDFSASHIVKSYLFATSCAEFEPPDHLATSGTDPTLTATTLSIALPFPSTLYIVDVLTTEGLYCQKVKLTCIVYTAHGSTVPVRVSCTVLYGQRWQSYRRIPTLAAEGYLRITVLYSWSFVFQQTLQDFVSEKWMRFPAAPIVPHYHYLLK